MPPEIAVSCHRCGRTFPAAEVELYGHRFPTDRHCVPCREAERADADQRRGDALIARARVPGEYGDARFDTFERRTGNETAFALAASWSRDLRRGAPARRGLLFQGPPGSGKTHLSVAILREFVFGTFSSALFLNVPEWLNAMKDAFQTGDGTPPPSPRGYRLVVLDDLGAERATPWSTDQLYSIVNHRESNGLPTVASTNLSDAELEARLGRATMSRLGKLCQRVPVEPGIDWRSERRAV